MQAKDFHKLWWLFRLVEEKELQRKRDTAEAGVPSREKRSDKEVFLASGLTRSAVTRKTVELKPATAALTPFRPGRTWIRGCHAESFHRTGKRRIAI